MPVSPSDPAYLAEEVPASLTKLVHGLCDAYGVSYDHGGTKGNLSHTNGYHRSRRYNQQNAPGNYSIQLAEDKQGDPDNVSAFDFTPADWGSSDNRAKMITITRRMRAAALAHDSRVQTMREFAGTEDGTHVVTFDMRTGASKTPFDSSHLDHGHGSIYRAYAANDHTGILHVMLGMEEQDMTPDERQRLINTDQSNHAFNHLHDLADGMTVAGYSDATGHMEMPVVSLLKRLDEGVGELTTAVTLSPASVDAVAQRVVELLAAQGPGPGSE